MIQTECKSVQIINFSVPIDKKVFELSIVTLKCSQMR